MNSRDRLSINRFRDVDIESLSEDDFIDFVFAKLMQEVIQRLEGSIQNDRIYNRAKFDVMASFWNAVASLDKRAQQDAQP